MHIAADAAVDDAKRGPATSTADQVVLTEAIRHEHSLAFWQAVKLYPAAVGWSMFVSIGVIMLAFDPQLLGNLYATPQFAADFGYEYEGEVSRLDTTFLSATMDISYSYSNDDSVQPVHHQ